ncbi:MAG TPA: type II secretion system minor pseudopilin GspI [Smithella sp.]|nr:type II secretion system minor pseudopilin GspI [Smithella sp.]NMC96537.1 type II secretion system minor pseudopilin GspI [Deltaproteobacteria bacterium]HNQ66416.1 type II secretion system minor pseudopilin GspI [Smithella sp.]HOE33184.1 type II secretion system minor pseudopilin GspI [Smithella sp.]HOG09906.1 type II secretion system minor pseudopilin GspI [Smithella sp.]
MTRMTEKGFTLMEVMVAMAILAIALVSIFQLQSQSISMATDSRFMTTAALLAQSKMVEVETQSPLSNKTENGDFGPDYPQYAWQLIIGDTQLPQFKKIEVTVTNKLFLRRGTYTLILYKRPDM